MSDNELTIKLNADITDVKAKYDDVKDKTEKLSDTLTEISKVSAVAFAALSAQVGISLKAFSEAELASNNLSTALQNQGIFTTELKDKYKEYAEQVALVAGVEKDEIIRGQALAQSFIGQKPVTKELTMAMADLAAKMGISIPEAGAMLGKEISLGTGMLARQGLTFASTSTEAERYTKTLEWATTKITDLAKAHNDATFGVGNLKNAIKENQEELGARFAPAFKNAIELMTWFITPAKNSSGEMTNFKAAAITAGLAVTGLGIALPIVGQGLLAVRAAIVALNVSISALTGIGIAVAAISFAVVEAIAHWSRFKALVVGVVTDLGAMVDHLFTGMTRAFFGFIDMVTGHGKDELVAGLNEMKQAFTGLGAATKKEWNDVTESQKKALEVQEKGKKESAAKDAAERKRVEDERKAAKAAQLATMAAEQSAESAEMIALKKQEAQQLAAIETQKDADLRAAQLISLKQTRAEIEAQKAQDKAKADEWTQVELASKTKLDLDKQGLTAQANKKELSAIQSTQLTEQQVKNNAYLQERKDLVKAHNTFLEEQNKYGTAYATINKIMHSTVIQGAGQAFGELQQMQTSHNAALKAIGKAAAIAQIIISTAQSAMSIFQGFSTIPFVGYGLGVIGAAAAVAFGAEKISEVGSAQQGGIVGGSGSGDHMPFMLEPGELVAPRKNFDEVVNSVAQSRSGDSGSGDSGSAHVQLSFAGDFGKVIEAKIIERQRLGVSLLPRLA